jgi:hypothetical protein
MLYYCYSASPAYGATAPVPSSGAIVPPPPGGWGDIVP